jgi:hydroxyethylthiazole kinase
MQHPQAAAHDDLSCKELVSSAAALVERLRAKSPRVHCITNAVAQNFTANALLAAGCVPSMTLSSEEIGGFVARSDALLVNLGTFDRERREAAGIAVTSAARDQVPWVLDPVFVDRSAPRAGFARDLIGQGPKVVRLNHAEFSALAGEAVSQAALAAYARDKKTVIALSGEVDWITNGARLAEIANGHPLMAKVTAMGCAASALVAACLSVEPDAFRASAAALLMIGVAGELAAAQAQGPASFAVAIVDALYNLNGKTLIENSQVNLTGKFSQVE